MEHAFTPPAAERTARDDGETALAGLRRAYERALGAFSDKVRAGEAESDRARKTRAVEATARIVSRGLEERTGTGLTDERRAVLRLKIARHLQREDSVDASALRDALLETPGFLDEEKGSLRRLFEIHEQKALLEIADARKRKAEQTGYPEENPYEALFTTVSGDYYLARLLNMSHLEQESAYMQHCVGESDSYVNKMKRGDIEIFSLKRIGAWNEKTERFGDDAPVATIEYNVRTATITQIKLEENELIAEDDRFLPDVRDAICRLAETKTDAGARRKIVRVAASELEKLDIPEPAPGHVLASRGEVSVSAFDEERHGFILKVGNMDGATKDDIAKLLKICQGVNVGSDAIARNVDDATDQTTVFVDDIGDTKDFFKRLPEQVRRTYRSPEDKTTIQWFSFYLGGTSKRELMRSIDLCDFSVSPWTKTMMSSPRFDVAADHERATCVLLSGRDMGFDGFMTMSEMIDRAEFLGLESCPSEAAVRFRLAYANQPIDEYVRVVMEPILCPDNQLRSFFVIHVDGMLRLDDYVADERQILSPDDLLLFRLRRDGQHASGHAGGELTENG